MARTATLANSELLAGDMPDARLTAFAGGHLVFLQDRSASPAIIEFLQDGHQTGRSFEPPTDSQENH